MMMKCPACSAEVEYIEGDCEFCPECGNELKPSQTSEVADSPPENQEPEEKSAVAADDLKSENLEAEIAKLRAMLKAKMPSVSTENDDDWDLSAISKKAADNIDAHNIFSTFSGTCKHVRVEYNRNLFFLTGSDSVIKFRLTPLDDKLQDLMIFMETERNGSHTRRQIPVHEVLRRNRTIYLQTSYNPGEVAGGIYFTFYIGCKINGSFTYYQFAVDHKVYSAKDSGQSISTQITINQEFNANQAADINYRDSIGDALKKMASKTLSANEMIDQLNALPAEYREKDLMETNWRPEAALVKGNLYHTQKLILEYDGKSLFLFNKKCVMFGRDPKEMDLVVRCGQGKLDQRTYPNSTVSRKHAGILYCEDTVKLFDYSSYGTYIDGKKPDSRGIPLETNARIEFGDICWNMNIQQCEARLPHNICQTCAANKVKSVTFTRKDDEPEYYLLIWQCCELGRLIEDLTDWTIFSRNDCFFIRTPDYNFYHLRPGQPVIYKGKEIKVKYFEQK